MGERAVDGEGRGAPLIRCPSDVDVKIARNPERRGIMIRKRTGAGVCRARRVRDLTAVTAALGHAQAAGGWDEPGAGGH